MISSSNYWRTRYQPFRQWPSSWPTCRLDFLRRRLDYERPPGTSILGIADGSVAGILAGLIFYVDVSTSASGIRAFSGDKHRLDS
jgi:hypothetical protein